MFSQSQLDGLAAELENARATGTQLRHFSQRFPDMTIADGYAIQQAWVKRELSRGRVIRGRKIGLTSKAMQRSSQIDTPDYAPLMDDMFFAANGAIDAGLFIKPRVEVELAFVLGRDLKGPGVSIFDVLAATDYVVPALEIIDARIEQFDRETGKPRKVYDTISDFAANAGIVMGGTPVAPDVIDLPRVGAALYRNGVIEETGLALGVLGHPANGIVWLANTIATYGEQLNAGDVVLAGSFTRPVTAAKGDTLQADYGELGSIAFQFA